MPNLLGAFQSSSKAWSFGLDVSCHLGKSIPFHQLKCQILRQIHQRWKFLESPPKTRGSTSTPCHLFVVNLWLGRGEEIHRHGVFAIQTVCSFFAWIRFGATEKTTRRFCDSSPPWKWTNPERNITSPSGFKEIRRREKNEKTFLFVAIKCLRKWKQHFCQVLQDNHPLLWHRQQQQQQQQQQHEHEHEHERRPQPTTTTVTRSQTL